MEIRGQASSLGKVQVVVLPVMHREDIFYGKIVLWNTFKANISSANHIQACRYAGERRAAGRSVGHNADLLGF